MKKVITITTDFGDAFAASQLRTVIATLGFDGLVIDNHSVSPFAISEGAFEIKQLSSFSAEGSVHVGVIDPGVGSERWGVAIETERAWYVGPNNGLLYPAAVAEGIKSVWRLQETAFGDNVSNTFHGRDVFIKAAVFLSQGKSPTDFSSIQVSENDLEKRSFSDGEIIHIDAYGNYKVFWSDKLVIGKKLTVENKEGKKFILPIVKTFDDVSPQVPLALLGSHRTLEIAVNLANAEKFFEFGLGEKLKIEQKDS